MKIIAELGINHRGSPAIAEQLVDIAADAGAWAAKFQYRSKEGFYQSTNEIGDEILSSEIDDCYLSPEEVLALVDRIQSRGLLAGISFFKFEDSFDFGDDIARFDLFKVPSAELLNIDLIEQLADLRKPIILSTGGHSQEDILSAISATKKIPYISYLHCISNYPVLLGNQQMHFIKEMREFTEAPIGYSSHDQDWEVCLVAAANGATVFERHLTTDKNGKGIDDSSSSDPREFRRLCKLLNAYDELQGNGPRVVNQGERINMQNLGSSLYASKEINPGDAITEFNTVTKAPRKGITWQDLKERDSVVARRHVAAGEEISELAFQKEKSPLDSKLVEFCNNKKLSIPIRLHDAKILQTRFPISNNELHLSYQEVAVCQKSISDVLGSLDLTRSYSIHIPDYVNSKTLIDPISCEVEIAAQSQELIGVCVDLAIELESKTGNSVPIVGSFSRVRPEGKTESYIRLNETLNVLGKSRGAPIFPQWLPKIAWYFGGAEVLDMFCGEDDIDIVCETNLQICLDISHLILSANYAKCSWRSWYDSLLPYAKHVHLSDAVGIDGEGVAFGEGDLGDPSIFLEGAQRKVLEVWQGHLSEGDGFEDAIHQLGEKNG